jgi:hypothetical protein
VERCKEGLDCGSGEYGMSRDELGCASIQREKYRRKIRNEEGMARRR